MTTRRAWSEIDGLLVPMMFYGVLVFVGFALLFRFLPGNPAWAGTLMFVAVAVVVGAVVRVGVLIHRVTR